MHYEEESDEDYIMNSRSCKMPRGVLTLRDQLMISKALCIAVEVLNKEEYPPTSDIATMEDLIDDRFPLQRAIEHACKQSLELLKNNEL